MDGPELDRREVLRRGGRLAAGAAMFGMAPSLLAACSGNDQATPPGTTGAARASGTGTTVAPTSSGGVPWGDLAGQLRGVLVLPSDGGYDDARVLFNTRFDPLRPGAVARCADQADVQAAVRFARANGVRLVARSGGHSYAGYSSADAALQLDLRGLDGIEVDRSTGQATLGPGCLLADVYRNLSEAGVCVPGGSCPTVNVAGLAMGGGVGFLGRAFGTLSDNLVGLTMVTVDGEVVSADASNEPDLLWAHRGGGGGNFGIVTRLELTTHPVGAWSTFELTWPWSITDRVTAAWFAWLADLPDEVWSMLSFTTQDPGQGNEPVCTVKGQVTAPAARAEQLLAPLVTAVGQAPAKDQTVNRTWLESADYWAGCADLSIAQCRIPEDGPRGTLPRLAYKAKSDYLAKALPAEGTAVVIDALNRRQADRTLTASGSAFQPGGIEFDSYGGALNRPAPDATAFVHRDQVAHGQYLAFWDPSAPDTTVQANMDWIERFASDLRPFASGQAYQNYIDPQRPDWLRSYYGQNLERLVAVKRRWDPDGVLDFAQGIPRTL